MLAELENKKLGIIPLLSLALDIYKKNFKVLVAVVTTIYLPVVMINNILLFLSLDNFNSLTLTIVNPIAYFSSIIFSLFSIVPIHFAIMATTVVVERYVLCEKITYTTALKKSFSRLWSFCLLGVRVFIVFELRLLLLIIPGVIYFINCYFFSHAFILRDQRGNAALSYSRALVKGNWWKVFFIYITQMSIVFGSLFITLRIFPANDIVALLLRTIVAILVGSYIFVINTLLFLNLDYRKNPIV
ncbi:MAG: hypothetical protein KME38_07075 [Spirirestis rafaelensis WJT71-NPBG6]|jgi:hypothetical protein|nr:hypothetical protein [Spirirestis rafaelensis WJT71-NPBG6]